MLQVLFVALFHIVGGGGGQRLSTLFTFIPKADKKSNLSSAWLFFYSGTVAWVLAGMSVFLGWMLVLKIPPDAFHFGDLWNIWLRFSYFYLIWGSLLYVIGNYFCPHLRKNYLSPLKFLGFFWLHMFPFSLFYPLVSILNTIFPLETDFLLGMLILFSFFFFYTWKVSLHRIWRLQKHVTTWFINLVTFALSLPTILPFSEHLF